MTTLTLAKRATFALPRGILATLIHLDAVARQRAALRRLDDARLSDLGLTRDTAAAEADRPAWDAPRHWHK